MSLSKVTRERSPLRIQVACCIACILFLILAGVAYRLSPALVGPASAQVEKQLLGIRLAMALPTAKPAEPGVTIVRPPVAAMIISHAQPTSDTSVTDVLLTTDADDWAGYEPWTAGRADTYRTVCVRLCDGAYHPISFSTTRDRFKADAARCQAGCDQPSKLFVVKPEGSPEDMVGVRGGSYTDLPNAFKFQTSYNAACSCGGQPWEAKAQNRHRLLAAAQDSRAPQKLAGLQSRALAVSGVSRNASTFEDTMSQGCTPGR